MFLDQTPWGPLTHVDMWAGHVSYRGVTRPVLGESIQGGRAHDWSVLIETREGSPAGAGSVTRIACYQWDTGALVFQRTAYREGIACAIVYAGAWRFAIGRMLHVARQDGIVSSACIVYPIIGLGQDKVLTADWTPGRRDMAFGAVLLTQEGAACVTGDVTFVEPRPILLFNAQFYIVRAGDRLLGAPTRARGLTPRRARRNRRPRAARHAPVPHALPRGAARERRRPLARLPPRDRRPLRAGMRIGRPAPGMPRPAPHYPVLYCPGELAPASPRRRPRYYTVAYPYASRAVAQLFGPPLVRLV